MYRGRAYRWYGDPPTAREIELIDDGPRVESSRYVAMDCEMVGVGYSQTDALARCSIVDFDGRTLYDSYCRPDGNITNYRTQVSGIRPSHIQSAPSFTRVQREVRDILKGKIVIGHSVKNDFDALKIDDFPKEDIRDTKYSVILRRRAGECRDAPVGLKVLCFRVLGERIQTSLQGHSSVEDAQAVMNLFKKLLNIRGITYLPAARLPAPRPTALQAKAKNNVILWLSAITITILVFLAHLLYNN